MKKRSAMETERCRFILDILEEKCFYFFAASHSATASASSPCN